MKNEIKKLIELIKDIVVEQATRDISGTDWGNEKIEQLNKLSDNLNTQT